MSRGDTQVRCHKCGAELHPDQKVCIACGERTAAGGNFYVEEKEKWCPSRNQIVVAGAAALIIIMLLIAYAMRPLPPDVIATKWFTAMAQRQLGTAEGYVTEQFKENATPGQNDLRALSDNYFDIIDSNQASWTLSKPVYINPTTADIDVTMKAQGDEVGKGQIELVKIGRRWMINKAN